MKFKISRGVKVASTALITPGLLERIIMNMTTFKVLMVATLIAITLNTTPVLAQEREYIMEWEADYDKGYEREKQVMRKKNNLWFGLKKQEHCPITQRTLTRGDKQPFIYYKGYKIYLSSDSVARLFWKYPKRALRRIYDNGEQPLKLDLCEFCGEEKGTYKCCRDREDTVICNKCGKHLNSPGHCVPYGLIIPVPAPGDTK
jgi:hypothetical protein